MSRASVAEVKACSVEECGAPRLARGWCQKHYLRWYKRGAVDAEPTNWHGLPLEQRFWLSVDPGAADECWEWKLNRVRGYGRIMVAGKIVGAHRVSYELHHGPIPAGMHVRHRCDNRPCVNPAHLELGTHAENMADKVARGRQSRQPGESSPTARLTDAQVYAIRASDRRAALVAVEFGISVTHVRRIRSRRSWAHLEELAS